MNETKTAPSNCEDCLFYDYTDDESDDRTCQMDMDEDDMVRYLNGTRGGCPYYRPYDEYKSVRRQN